MMSNKKTILVLIVGAALLGVALFQVNRSKAPTASENQAGSGAAQQQTAPSQKDPIWFQYDTAGLNRTFVPPLSELAARQVKKPFGIYVTPKNSPTQPEHFTGYHTGADFEIFEEELNKDVPVMAICDGKFLLKKNGQGYGGYAVQSCTLNGDAITVLYGHLRLSSITPNVGDTIKAGQTIAVLGNAFSAETDGERKHLHISVHKGAAVVPAGYAQNRTGLTGWIDPLALIQE